MLDFSALRLSIPLVGGLLGPDVLPLPRGGAEVRDELIFIGLIWTLLRWKGEIWRQADSYSQQVFPKLPHRERLFLFDLSDKLFTVLVVVVIIGMELLRLLCYVASGEITTAWDLQQELLLRIGEVVEKPQAKMPFPIRNLIQT